MSELSNAIEYVERNHPLLRCEHGNALRDHAGERLEPPCGCRPGNSTRREAERIVAALDWLNFKSLAPKELTNAIDKALQARDERAAKIADKFDCPLTATAIMEDD